MFVLAVAATLWGCKEEEKVIPNPDQSFEKVKSAGVLVMGHMGAFPPMVYTDKDSNFIGFDIDLASEVCKRLGLKLKHKVIAWEDKEKELNAGNIDCVWNGMSIDSARAAAMNLSDPYLTNRMVFTIKNKAFDHPDSLKGKKIGVQKASTAQPLLEKSSTGEEAKEIVVFENVSLALEALEQGTVDAVYTDEVAAKHLNVLNGTEYIFLEEGSANEFYAVGFRKKDEALRDTINAVLNTIKRDGKFIDISIKWFGK